MTSKWIIVFWLIGCSIFFSCSDKKEIEDEIEGVNSKADSTRWNLEEISNGLDKMSEDSTDYKFH